jgi:hypothetical protein
MSPGQETKDPVHRACLNTQICGANSAIGTAFNLYLNVDCCSSFIVCGRPVLVRPASN